MKPCDVESWGVDIGNVIVRNMPARIQKLALEPRVDPRAVVRIATLVPDSLLGLKFLIQQVGRENVWIISKASPKQIVINRLIFEKFNICKATGLDPEQILFCPERKDKLPIIKALELQGHIDDRGEVIESIQSYVKCPIWFNPEEEDIGEWLPRTKYSVRIASDWKQIIKLF